MLTTIYRNPFARQELVRAVIPLRNRTGCTECGSLARFRYGYVSDDRPGTVHWIDGRFCSIGCMRSYNPE